MRTAAVRTGLAARRQTRNHRVRHRDFYRREPDATWANLMTRQQPGLTGLPDLLGSGSGGSPAEERATTRARALTKTKGMTRCPTLPSSTSTVSPSPTVTSPPSVTCPSRCSRGELYALLGTNGAGKTSTLEVVEGHRRATSGTVRIFGESPQDRRAVRPRMGIMLQESGFSPDLTVRESVGPDRLPERAGATTSTGCSASWVSPARRAPSSPSCPVARNVVWTSPLPCTAGPSW